MRRLRVFTPRGLGLLCIGVAVLAGGWLLGQRDFVALGTLALALPLLSLLTVARAPRNITHSRALQPARVSAGTDARVLLRIANSSAALPIGGLLAEDTLPFPLGQEPRFTIGYLRPRGVQDLSYRVRTHIRGHYPIGPLKLRFIDPLGCVRLRRQVGTHMSLLVTPPIVLLPDSPLKGGSAETGQSPTRSVAGVGEDDVIPREYRHGDDLRRVHWRSTARHGQLMVRREEHQWRDHSEILLDMRAGAHAGAGPDSSLETGVSAAASIALHLLGYGQEVRLVTDDREIPAPNAQSVIDALTVAQSSAAESLRGGLDLLSAPPAAGGGLFIALLGALQTSEAETLARARAAADRNCVAILCRRAAWSSPETLRQSEEALLRAGWAVLEIGSADELAEAWPHLPARAGVKGGSR